MFPPNGKGLLFVKGNPSKNCQDYTPENFMGERTYKSPNWKGKVIFHPPSFFGLQKCWFSGVNTNSTNDSIYSFTLQSFSTKMIKTWWWPNLDIRKTAKKTHGIFGLTKKPACLFGLQSFDSIAHGMKGLGLGKNPWFFRGIFFSHLCKVIFSWVFFQMDFLWKGIKVFGWHKNRDCHFFLVGPSDSDVSNLCALFWSQKTSVIKNQTPQILEFWVIPLMNFADVQRVRARCLFNKSNAGVVDFCSSRVKSMLDLRCCYRETKPHEDPPPPGPTMSRHLEIPVGMADLFPQTAVRKLISGVQVSWKPLDWYCHIVISSCPRRCGTCTFPHMEVENYCNWYS